MISLAQLEQALTQQFDPILYPQFNRQARLLAQASATPDIGGGKNAAWDVVFSGATAGAVSEGSDVQASEFSNDVEVPAVMPWCHYRSSFQITETAVDTARSAGNPSAFDDIFGEKIEQNGSKLMSDINQDFWSGTGTGTGIDGVTANFIQGVTGGALDTSSAYAGISRSKFTEWQSNVLANGGQVRPLTKDLLDQGEANLFTAAGSGFDWVYCSAGVARKYEGLFTPAQRQDLVGTDAMKMGMGGGVGLDISGFYRGRPVIRDKDAPSGTLLMGSSRFLSVKALPRFLTRNDAVGASTRSFDGTNGAGGVTPVRLQFRIAYLAKTGDSYKFSIKATFALLFKRPNAFALIKDIEE